MHIALTYMKVLTCQLGHYSYIEHLVQYGWAAGCTQQQLM